MRNSTEPPDPDLELFRSVRSDQVLRGCGDVFREKDQYTAPAGTLPSQVTARLLDSAAAAYYRRSEPCARADAFVSHAWHDDHRLKYLALCYQHNLGRAVTASVATWFCLLVGLVAAAGDVTAYGGPSSSWLTYVFTGIPGAVFLTVFCAGCLLGFGTERWWVDKLCIHQRDERLKDRAIRAVPSFLKRCDRLIVLKGESYLERLWCVYELATFLAERSLDRVDLVPLWLAPWLLATMAMDFCCSLLANALMYRVLYAF